MSRQFRDWDPPTWLVVVLVAVAAILVLFALLVVNLVRANRF